MSRYDQKTTSFSPEGRIFQVEYSIEAINKAGFCCGIKTNEGIVFIGERKAKHKLMDKKETEKFSKIDDHIVVGAAGVVADADYLVDFARKISNYYREVYNEPTPANYICRRIGDTMQYYTQNGGLRPFGVKLMFASYSPENDFMLHTVDPSGNFSEWMAHACGNGSQSAMSTLKTEYDSGVSLFEGIKLAVKIALKCCDNMNDAEKIDLFTFTLENGAPVFKSVEEELKINVMEDAKAQNENEES